MQFRRLSIFTYVKHGYRCLRVGARIASEETAVPMAFQSYTVNVQARVVMGKALGLDSCEISIWSLVTTIAVSLDM
jgi:hypothetical protein